MQNHASEHSKTQNIHVDIYELKWINSLRYFKSITLRILNCAYKTLKKL